MGKGFSSSPRGTGGFTPTSNGPLRWALSSSSPPHPPPRAFGGPSRLPGPGAARPLRPGTDGPRGRPFKAYKFRTMRGAPREGVYAGAEADRITPLGKLLRKLRLDELPQLWNVLRGEMALVGPRPEQKVLAEKYAEEIPSYMLRHVVRPGLTGWAQVHHGYAEGLEGTIEKLSYDLYYVKHCSFWLDLRILVRTLWVILTGFGAK